MANEEKVSQNKSTDINDHIGFLWHWVGDRKRRGHFDLWDNNELFNQAYVTAADLLKRNYRPEKGTVSTYLSYFLWSRVAYAYGKYHGWRYRKGKWVTLEFELQDGSATAIDDIEKPELPRSLSEEEMDIVLMRVNGRKYREISKETGHSVNTVYKIVKRIREKIDNENQRYL